MSSPADLHIRVQVVGELGAAWSTAFADLTGEPGIEETTFISGEVRDRAALHGLSAVIPDLGLPLLSVETVMTPASGA